MEIGKGMAASKNSTAISQAPRGVTAIEMDAALTEILGLAREGGAYREMIDLLPDLVYVKDRLGRYVLSNAAHARFLGCRASSEVEGKTAFDFFPEELARRYSADDTRVMETGQEIVEDIEPSVGDSGEPRIMTRTKRAMRDRSGRIVGLVGFARDVTEQVRAQECMRAMQETLEQQIIDRTAAAETRSQELAFLRFALDQCAIVATTDARGRMTHVNDKFCNISGYSRDELIGQDDGIISSGVHPKGFFRKMYSTIAKGKVWKGDICNRAKDGSLYWVDTTIVPIVDDPTSGKINGYVVIRQDITQHKQSEEALRQRTIQLEAAAEAAERSNRELRFQKFALDQHAIVAVTDARGRITYVNDKFCEISKYTRKELIGQDHRIVNSGVHSKAFFKQMYATIAGGNVWHGEIRNRAKDGSLYWVDTTIVPIRDDDTGKNKGYVAIRADITALKRTQEHLQQAKEAAEAASHAKGEFLANMSHEIRTPMTAIIGYADLLADANRPMQERMEFVQTIRRNGEHLLIIINDLLDLSKVEAGKLQVEAIACSPSQIVSEVDSCMSVRAIAKGIDFHVEMDPRIPRRIYSDPTRLRQVLFNLVSNAIKFTEAGGVRIAASWDAGSGVVRFDVIDTGIGLTADQQCSVFKPFAQADNSTTRRFGGTGLGLALSKRLVEMLGGELTLLSEPGKGSTFSFSVADRKQYEPVADDSRSAPVNAMEEAADDSHAQRLHGRLLLVEDGADNRRLVTIYLEDAGLTVDFAENGKEALKAVTQAQTRRQPYDVILMDMQMPVMDGYQATAELRSRGFSKTPIIAFTAHAMESEREKCMAAGCDDYATKPVNPDRLIRTIAKQLQRNEQTRKCREPRAKYAAADLTQTQNPAPAALATTTLPTSSGLRSIYADNVAVRRVLPSYIADLPRHVAELSLLLAERRLADLRRLVHQLKGSGGGYGFLEISGLAGNVEATIDANAPLDGIEAAVRELCDLLRNVEGYEPESETAVQPASQAA
jgi:PAS domain S-box-containing protein